MVNQLFYGDNLRILRNDIRDESVDLVYLDPPFNSKQSYNLLFKHKSGEAAQGQIEAFDDTWTWSQESEAQYEELVGGGAPAQVADAMQAMRRLLGDNDLLAYLVMMTARLVELHRVLKSTGSLYLHCDPSASHYLKIMLDAIFGPERFVNEIIWKRSSAHSDSKQGSKHYGRVSDTILFYSKSEVRTWNQQYGPYDQEYIDRDYRRVEEGTGRRFRISDMSGPGGAAKGNPAYEVMGVTRHWRFSKETMEQLIADGRVVQTSPGAVPQQKRYLDEMPGVPLQNVWTDVPVINNRSKEKLGYPTQKPLALLERIIQTSSNSGDVVLDPFCGCGTTIDAAQKLGRKWVGVDITYLAIDLIEKRLRATYGDEVRETFEVRGVPREIEAAQRLFKQNAFDFERWAVSLVSGEPNQKQVGDKGIDGVIRFYLNEKKETGEALVSVKGGAQLNPAMVRDLRGTVERRGAAMGVFVCMNQPTKGMVEEAQHSGSFTYEFSGASFPRIQLITVAELLHGKRPAMPTPILPYKLAKKRSGQTALFDSGG